MIAQVASYTLRHRAIVIALLLLFIFAGINAFERLPVEAFPDVSNKRRNAENAGGEN